MTPASRLLQVHTGNDEQPSENCLMQSVDERRPEIRCKGGIPNMTGMKILIRALLLSGLLTGRIPLLKSGLGGSGLLFQGHSKVS